MSADFALAVRPLIAPLGRIPRVGRAATTRATPNSRAGQLIRLTILGQANATLVRPPLKVLENRIVRLNPRPLRRRWGQELNLSARDRLKWAKERRVCLLSIVELADQRRAVLANAHTTAYPEAVAEAELEVARRSLEEVAGSDDILVLAGDFNLSVETSAEIRALTAEHGFSSPGSWVDHIFVRGATASAPEAWPNARRSVGDRLLSDHAPVDVRVSY
jgi:endonuclease/exonuclease/phosphatase family metal-dependent hydrolase